VFKLRFNFDVISLYDVTDGFSIVVTVL